MSRICEEFSCTPLEALAQPLGLTLDILELRQYARAWEQIQAAQDDRQVTPAARALVAPVLADLEAERAAARGGIGSV